MSSHKNICERFLDKVIRHGNINKGCESSGELSCAVQKLKNFMWRNILDVWTKKEKRQALSLREQELVGLCGAGMKVTKITWLTQNQHAQALFKHSKKENVRLPNGDHTKLSHNKEKVCCRWFKLCRKNTSKDWKKPSELWTHPSIMTYIGEVKKTRETSPVRVRLPSLVSHSWRVELKKKKIKVTRDESQTSMTSEIIRCCGIKWRMLIVLGRFPRTHKQTMGQHNWPHFKTFVILIATDDAYRIWYRWKALGEAHRGKFSISWKEVAYLNNVLFKISKC